MNKKVLVGIPTMGFSRNDSFYDYYNMLERPAGTICTFARGQSPARNRNIIIELALQHECSHIMFFDDDLAFAPDVLIKLMAHDLDIVSGLYLMRSYPHQPIIFDYSDSTGKCSHLYPEKTSGLVKIVNCGLGICLINTRVFKSLEKPYIRLGELEQDHWCDDIGFFNRVRKAGFELYCDLDVRAGHMCQTIVWPDVTNNKWNVTYDTNGKGRVTFPAIVPELV